MQGLRRLHDFYASFATQGRSHEGTPSFQNYVLFFIFCPEARFSIARVVGSGMYAASQNGWSTIIAGYGRHIRLRGRTNENVEHVGTQCFALGGQQNSAAGVKKFDAPSATRSAHTAGQNQPSDASTTIDACYTQGYDRGYNLGSAKKFGSQRQFAPNPRAAKFGQDGGFVRIAAKEGPIPFEKRT